MVDELYSAIENVIKKGKRHKSCYMLCKYLRKNQSQFRTELKYRRLPIDDVRNIAVFYSNIIDAMDADSMLDYRSNKKITSMLLKYCGIKKLGMYEKSCDITSADVVSQMKLEDIFAKDGQIFISNSQNKRAIKNRYDSICAGITKLQADNFCNLVRLFSDNLELQRLANDFIMRPELERNRLFFNENGKSTKSFLEVYFGR
jgi:hypothetical protein